MVISREMVVSQKPSKLPLTVEACKEYARIYHDKDDAQIDQMLRASVQYFENYTGQALISQQRTMLFTAPLYGQIQPCDTFDLWGQPIGNIIQVQAGPLGSMSVVTSGYSIIGLRAKSVRFTNYPEQAQIVYECGFGDNGADLPEDMRECLYKMVADLYDNRAITLSGTITSKFSTFNNMLFKYKTNYFLV